MPYQKQIAELELRIENLRLAIEALRIGKATRTEMDRALSDLARAKADRLRLMLRQVNFRSERGLHQATATSATDRGKDAGPLGNPDG
jgi:hypothetical protein